jgi:hypothetical protein
LIDGVLEYESIPNKENIKEVIIGNKVTSIDHAIFCFCTTLTTVNIPDSVISIGE